MAYIDASKLEKFIEDGLNNPNKSKAFGHDAVEILAQVFIMQLEEDIVKVVRCAECINRGTQFDDVFYCHMNKRWHEPNHYCGYGRKEGN